MQNHHEENNKENNEEQTTEDDKGRLSEGIDNLVEEVQKVVKVEIGRAS